MDILCCSWQRSFGFAYVHVGGAVYIAGRGDGNILVGKITMPGNQLYTKLCNKYVANFTSLMRRENQQIQLMLILCYPVI